MSEKGFVYTGTLSEEDLSSLLERLKVAAHFCWSLAELKAGEDLPDDLKESGTAFNKRCEVRWQRIDENEFRVLVLCDEPQGELPLSPAEGEWTTETQETQLWNLKEAAINPPFENYPILSALVGKLRCRVFYRDGMAMFLSPREVLRDETPGS